MNMDRESMRRIGEPGWAGEQQEGKHMHLHMYSHGKKLGTAQLQMLDHHFYYASGWFEPTDAFTHVQPLFEHAPPDMYWADLLGDAYEPDSDIQSFCLARDQLQLHLRGDDGVRLPIQVIAIMYDPEQQQWHLLARAHGEGHFNQMAQLLYTDAAEVFVRHTHPWPEAHESVIPLPSQIARVIAVLERTTTTKNNPVLIGKPGESRRAILAEAVRNLRQGKVANLIGWNIVELDGDGLHPSKIPDEARHQLKAVLWHAYTQTPRTLFLIERFDHLVHWAAPILKPFLARGQMRFIGTATLVEYRQDIERDAAIQRRVQEILVDI
jgi:hypothetical protein